MTLLARAVRDAEQVARSEIDLQKARLGAKVDAAKTGVGLLLGAALFGSLAAVALVVGTLLILTPLLGPLAATAIVAGVLLVLAVLLGLLGAQHFKRVFGTRAAA
ncbi:phage holin family protein [Sphingomonas sp. RB3P16]|uniref:phage holin family protein n=1 Tax=Parasphingomonas frigoris TaxID=3096163 RepID=UPI002FCA845B